MKSQKHFNSTLLDDGTIFLSRTVNTWIDLENNDQNSKNINNNNNVTHNIIDNTLICQNYQHRQPVNLTELTQNSDPMNTALPILPKVNTPLPRLHKQNSVHFNTKSTILYNSTQPMPVSNHNFQITPQQLVNIVRQLNSQIT